MAAQKSRQRAVQRAKAERMRAAQQRAAERRKRFVTGGAVVVVLALIVLVVVAFGGGSSKRTKTNVAVGKPCVRPVGPLPPGAPDVPVQVGPPPSKLIMTDLVPGTGAVVAPESTVTVNYIGVACTTGKVFDTSYGKTPATFALTQVIPGWTQGIPGMKVGGKRLLGIPSALAYGPQGKGADIGPDEPLWFVVEVVAAKA